MEMRPILTKLPEMFVSRDGVFRLWQAVRVEPGCCESREDDGERV